MSSLLLSLCFLLVCIGGIFASENFMFEFFFEKVHQNGFAYMGVSLAAYDDDRTFVALLRTELSFGGNHGVQVVYLQVLLHEVEVVLVTLCKA